MKRYSLELQQMPTCDGSETYYELEESITGEWVRHKDAQEIYDVLKQIPIGRVPSHLRLEVRRILHDLDD